MIKQYIFTILATLFFTQAGIAQSTGTFTDSRDGQTYKTVSFKNALTGATGYLDGPKPELQSAGELRL